MNGLADRLRSAFVGAFGSAAEPRIALAPGRVNLIGEHTDYNDGFVLPMGINRYVGVAFTPRSDTRVRAYAGDLDAHRELEIDSLQPGRARGWAEYVAGVFWAMREAGLTVRGLDLAVLGEVPIGAGLSSSAALELAVARAVCAASDIPWDGTRMANIGQQAEREFVGVSCGIMDQYAAALAHEHCALLLDCRSLATRLVPIPGELQVAVMDTGVRRTLAESAYNERRAQCQAAVEAIRELHPEVRALRDVSAETLEEVRDRLEPKVYRRALHVVQENQRPLQLADALASQRLLRAGRLMSDSHRSLRDLYEVSCPELDHVVELAAEHAACVGARLTGAGFGGCAVALVRRGAAADFVEWVQTRYREKYSHPSSVYICEAAPGAHLLSHPDP